MTVDLGTGDGRYPYEFARRSPDRFFVGIDANASAMGAVSHKIGRKPAKGGLGNALFVAAAVEALPAELEGIAARVTVLFPWGSLLRAIVLPEPDILAGIRRLCRPGATLEIVLGYDPQRERTEIDRLALPDPTGEYLRAELPPRYRDVGLRIERVEALTREALRVLPSAWAKRLGYGRRRDVWRIIARAAEPPPVHV